MRIALVVDQFPALSETFILNQITGLVDRGHEVDIFASRPSNGQLVHADVQRYRLLERTYYRPFNAAGRAVRALAAVGMAAASVCRSPRASLAALNTRRFGRAARSLRLLRHAEHFRRFGRDYDLVHCHYGPNGQIAAMARDLGALSGKIVTSFHGYDVNKLPRSSPPGLYDFLFRHGDLFLANSNFTRSRLGALGCPVERAVVHPAGIDVSRFRFRSRAGTDGGPVRVLTVARLVEVKGVEYGIRAVAELAEQNYAFRYQIVGDGPLRSRLESLTCELGVRDHVQLLGWRTAEQTADLYHQADLFLLPSVVATDGHEEAQGLVLQEAQAAGLPVVATRVGGIPEGVLHGQSGFLVPERDPDALAERLAWLIEHPQLWAEMGWKGRQFVEERYDINRLNDRLVALYERLVRGSVARSRTIGMHSRDENGPSCKIPAAPHSERPETSGGSVRPDPAEADR